MYLFSCWPMVIGRVKGRCFRAGQASQAWGDGVVGQFSRSGERGGGLSGTHAIAGGAACPQAANVRANLRKRVRDNPLHLAVASVGIRNMSSRPKGQAVWTTPAASAKGTGCLKYYAIEVERLVPKPLTRGRPFGSGLGTTRSTFQWLRLGLKYEFTPKGTGCMDDSSRIR